MQRTDRIVIRINAVERQVIDALAQAEKLPASTLARRRLLFEAEQRGIVPRLLENANRAGEGSEAISSAAAS
jgi:hypothetical protein